MCGSVCEVVCVWVCVWLCVCGSVSVLVCAGLCMVWVSVVVCAVCVCVCRSVCGCVCRPVCVVMCAGLFVVVCVGLCVCRARAWGSRVNLDRQPAQSEQVGVGVGVRPVAGSSARSLGVRDGRPVPVELMSQAWCVFPDLHIGFSKYWTIV